MDNEKEMGNCVGNRGKSHSPFSIEFAAPMMIVSNAKRLTKIRLNFHLIHFDQPLSPGLRAQPIESKPQHYSEKVRQVLIRKRLWPGRIIFLPVKPSEKINLHNSQLI